MITVVGNLAGWLYANVLGNLVASIICFGVGLATGSRWVKRRIAAHHAAMHAALDDHHAQVLAAVRATPTPPEEP